MNASRAYSITLKQNLPIGRVQTSTLSLIVERDRAVENYKESFTYSVIGDWCDLGFTYFEDDISRFEDQQYAKQNFHQHTPPI